MTNDPIPMIKAMPNARIPNASSALDITIRDIFLVMGAWTLNIQPAAGASMFTHACTCGLPRK